MGTRRSVVSYSVEASCMEKMRALIDGLYECSVELVELNYKDKCVDTLEQIINDIETDNLI